MDPLRKHVFDAIKAATCGDAGVDDTLQNTAAHIGAIIKNYEAAIARILGNKSRYTPEGQAIKRQEAAKKAQKELREIQEKSSWKPDVEKVERRFDNVESESDFKQLISSNLEREVRSHMRKFEGDALLFDANFGEAIRGGDAIICGAVVHSPLPLAIDPTLEKLAVEQYRLSRNPLAASRLKTLTTAQQIHENLFNFASAELGIESEDDIPALSEG